MLAAILMLLALITHAVVRTASSYEPYVNPVCRDQFGHRMECEE